MSDTAEVRERKRQDVIGILLAFANAEHMSTTQVERIQALGISMSMAQKMGLWPNAQQRLLDNVNVEMGRRMLQMAEKVQPSIKQQLRDEGVEIDESKPTGADALYAIKVIADRLIAILQPDSDYVEQFLQSLDHNEPGGQSV